MTNTLAIAAVTATIRHLMEKALGGPEPGEVGNAVATTLRPDQLWSQAVPGAAKGINVFLYEVTANHAWNLTDLPTRDSDGRLVQRPVAALDLHYLVSCYGDDAALDAQRLLGRAVLALATTPVLHGTVIQEAIERFADDPNPDLQALRNSDLGQQDELVKLTPATLPLEEMFRLWGVLGSPYLLSVAYTATVVLLQPQLTPRAVLPVRHPVIGITPSGRTRIERIEAVPAGSAVTTGTRVVVLGSALIAGDGTRRRGVRIGDIDLAMADSSTAQRVEVTVSSEVPAGVQSLRIIERTAGAGGARITACSNAVAIVVRPRVEVLEPPGTAARLRLRLTPEPRAGQDVVVVLDRLDAGPEPGTWEFAVQPAGDVEIDRTGVPAGQWRLQVRVDGVDSLPTLLGETYLGPVVVLS